MEFANRNKHTSPKSTRRRGIFPGQRRVRALHVPTATDLRVCVSNSSRLGSSRAAVNQARNDGETPLSRACQKGHLETVKLLSSYGATRDFTINGETRTAEGLSSYYGHLAVTAWLEDPTTAHLLPRDASFSFQG